MKHARFSIQRNLLALLGCITVAGAANAQSINVTMNEATILRIGGAANTVVVGNPEIADATVQDPQTIVLTGKGFGVTNIVVLNERGDPVVDEKIVVARQDAYSVRIYRQANTQLLSCTPTCEGAYKNAAEQQSDGGN